MTIKLILARTNYDAIAAWTDIKTVEVNLPLAADRKSTERMGKKE